MKIFILRFLHTSNTAFVQVWKYGLKPGSPPALAFAVICVAIAALIRHLLGLIDPAIIVFVPYFPAMLIATLIGGLPSGLITLVLATLSAWWSFIPPTHAFLPITQGQVTSLLIEFATGLIIILAAESHRRLLRRHYEKEHFDDLIISELRHRLRNKQATIQAVLRRELRDDESLRRKIEGRLAAIARVDELSLKTRGGVDISGIVKGELEPYGMSPRVKMSGDSVVLPTTLALSLTLVIHELATNAAKHGALSTPHASIDVAWRLDDDHVRMTWTESGKPHASNCGGNGFGFELFQRALAPFHGIVEPTFSPDGFRCRIAFSLPRDRLLRPLGADRPRTTSLTNKLLCHMENLVAGEGFEPPTRGL